jgi:hypothetical protein
MTQLKAPVTDLSFAEYTDRQFRELEPDRLTERAMALRPSGNYKYVVSKGWVPQSYPGFAVVSMVDENPGNGPLPQLLRTLQLRLMESCPWEESICLLPVSSFHQTVANTLSEERFLQGIVRPGLEPEYPSMVGKAFGGIPVALAHGRTLPMRLIGISIFGTALGLLGVFEDETAYQRIVDFRAHFYGNAVLTSLDVRMTRPFIGHITLAYIETELTHRQRDQLAGAVYAINRSLGNAAPSFNLSVTGLRRYHHLSSFFRSEDFPRYHF